MSHCSTNYLAMYVHDLPHSNRYQRSLAQVLLKVNATPPVLRLHPSILLEAKKIEKGPHTCQIWIRLRTDSISASTYRELGCSTKALRPDDRTSRQQFG